MSGPDIPPQSEPPRIADYALLSNCQGSALVSSGGSVDWACIPRFDSPALFARILGEPGGHWAVTVLGGEVARREYAEDTMVLETSLRSSTGDARVTDFMPLHGEDRHNDIGRRSPAALHRVVEVTRGTVDIEVELAVRPEFGLTTPLVRETAPGQWRTRGGPLSATISSTLGLERDGAILRGRQAVAEGEVLAFALEVADPWTTTPPPRTTGEILAARDLTLDGWRSWAEKLTAFRGRYRWLLRRSTIVLRALNYAPTGAIVAAPTTSLPEEIGGVRNWDYRYTWVRDASLTIAALAAGGCAFEASGFFEFFVETTAGSVESGQGLQIMYGIRGERFIPEHELTTLSGHRGSRPVRIGNGAWDQTQLDVFGEFLDSAWLVSQLGIAIDDEAASFLAGVADRSVLRWNDPDEGIWEVRGGAAHFLYSKLMNWVALDRAVRLAPVLGASPDRLGRWSEHRDRIREAILTEGWSDRVGAYTQAFGRDDLDSSVLMMPIVGFLPATDPRMRATVEAVAQHLSDDRGFVYRYLNEDGLLGREGTFGICTFWLAQCLALAGEVERARELFDRMAGCANDVGLLAEEVDPTTGGLLGNFPQAFTHIGLINAALAIENADAAP